MRRKGRGRQKQYRPSVFVKAIENSGGLISTICKRVGCCWETAAKYIDTVPEVTAAYQEEVERNGDVAESVLLNNIKMQAKEQSEKHRIVDTADAKWYLSKKCKSRGYGDNQRTELAISGKLGAEVDVNYTIADTAKILAVLADAGVIPAGALPADKTKADEVHTP